MPNRIREETNDLIILDDDPKKIRSAIIWGGVFVLFGIIAGMYYAFFLLFIVLGGIGFLSNLYSFYASQSVTVDKRNSNIVINSSFSRRKILFSEVNNVKIRDDTWAGEFVSNIQLYVITARGKFLIFNSNDASSVEQVAEKINKMNPTTCLNLSCPS